MIICLLLELCELSLHCDWVKNGNFSLLSDRFVHCCSEVLLLKHGHKVQQARFDELVELRLHHVLLHSHRENCPQLFDDIGLSVAEVESALLPVGKIFIPCKLM